MKKAWSGAAQALAEACAELDAAGLQDLLDTRRDLSRYEASPQRDSAIRLLETCRVKTSSRLRALARAGPSDAEIKRDIVRQSIASTPGSCPCPFHRARNGSRCGRRSSYSRYGGRVVKCSARDVSKDDVADYRASLAEDPLLAYRDQFSDTWTTRSGDVSVPAPAGPPPVMPSEVQARSAQLDEQVEAIDMELAKVADERSALQVALGAQGQTIERLERDEQMRQSAWRRTQHRRAEHGQWVGIGLGGLGAVGTLVGLYEVRKPSESRDGQTVMIAFGVGVPLLVLGVAVWASSKQRGRRLRTVSTSGGQLQVRF